MVLAAGLLPQSTASGPKIKFFCVLPEKAYLVYETGFDLLTCDGEKSHGNVLGDAGGLGRWLLDLASALCILDRERAGGSWYESGEPLGLQNHDCSTMLTECQGSVWHSAAVWVQESRQYPKLEYLFKKNLSNEIYIFLLSGITYILFNTC